MQTINHPDAPARSVQLSDGETWHYFANEPWFRRWKLPATEARCSMSLASPRLLHNEDSPLTADDHRKIADVLDPQPSSDGLASAIRILTEYRDELDGRAELAFAEGRPTTVLADKSDAIEDAIIRLRKAQAPTADGGTT